MTMKRHSRRTFVGGLAAGAVILGFSPVRRQWITDVQAEGVVDVETLPPLDGVLALDDASRDAAASDFGRLVQERPVAVLKPGSVRDLARIVRFARRHDLRIAVRGRAHSVHGETLVEGGIVFDMSTLTEVHRVAKRHRHRRCGLQLERRAGRDLARGADAAGAARLPGSVRGRHAVAGRHQPDDLSLRRAGRQRREPAGRDRGGAHSLVLADEEAGSVRGGPCGSGAVRGHRPCRTPARAGSGHGARVLAGLRRCRHRDERRGQAHGRRPVRWCRDVRRAHRRTAARDPAGHRLLQRPAGAGQRDTAEWPAPSPRRPRRSRT